MVLQGFQFVINNLTNTIKLGEDQIVVQVVLVNSKIVYYVYM